jgi:uncharacterized FlaG/YvyC family protein
MPGNNPATHEGRTNQDSELRTAFYEKQSKLAEHIRNHNIETSKETSKETSEEGKEELKKLSESLTILTSNQNCLYYPKNADVFQHL